MPCSPSFSVRSRPRSSRAVVSKSVSTTGRRAWLASGPRCCGPAEVEPWCHAQADSAGCLRTWGSTRTVSRVSGGRCGFLLQIARSAQRAPCRAPRPGSEAGRHAPANQEGSPGPAPGRQCGVLDAAFGGDGHPFGAQGQGPGMASWKLSGEPPESRGRSPLPEPLAALACATGQVLPCPHAEHIRRIEIHTTVHQRSGRGV